MNLLERRDLSLIQNKAFLVVCGDIKLRNIEANNKEQIP
jgi:hypothetical protein